jgi:hypothetical protein
MLTSKFRGAINAVSGQPMSFQNIGKIIQTLVPHCKVDYVKRSVDRMPHGGYRVFDIELIQRTYPELTLRSPGVGLNLMFRHFCP